MITVKKFQDYSADDWNSLCQKLPGATNRHRYEFLQFLAKSYDAEHCSVAIYNDHNELLGIVPLFFESARLPGDGSFISQSVGGGSSPQPLISKAPTASQARKRFKEIYEYVDSLCRERGAGRSLFDGRSLFCFENSARDSVGLMEPLLAGYSPTVFNSLNIDLRLSEEQLINNVSKFHRRHIRTAIRDGQKIKVVDRESGEPEIRKWFSAYQEAHTLASGRMTRPQASFDSMSDLIVTGGGALFINMIESEPISYLYCGAWGNIAFGWSQANIERFIREHSPRQLLEWEAILYYKRKGLHYYELGPRFCNGQVSFSASQKLINIATFKERFGGDLYPQIEFEKFFDPKLAELIFTNKLQEFLVENFRTPESGDQDSDS